MENSIQVCVVLALIQNEEGEILLQKRRDTLIPKADEKWELAGGKIDFGEKPDEALIRECKEEIGCDVEIVRLLPYVHSNLWERSDNKRAQVLLLCYECKIINGTPQPSDKKVAEIKWFSRKEIELVDVLPGIKEFIAFLKIGPYSKP